MQRTSFNAKEETQRTPRRIRLGVTMGDPGGIGPEIILKAFQASDLYVECDPVVIGYERVMEHYRTLLNVPMRLNVIETPSECVRQRELMNIIEPRAESLAGVAVVPGETNVHYGQIVFHCIEHAVRLAMQRKIDAICTAPISKETLHQAGYLYPGHTEILATLSRVKRYAMMMEGGGLRVVLATIHIPLREVALRIQRAKILALIQLTAKFMRYFDVPHPRIGVAALNPHAGEKGLFGKEDAQEIHPAVVSAQKKGITISGPHPADTLFYQMLQGKFDVLIAMYHDQALIPVKTLDFSRGVNITMGLPFIRTSVDHGTAFDIAGRGVADPTSLVEAMKTAIRLARTKQKVDTSNG